MTKKLPGKAFVKFDIERSIKAEFATCCEFYQTSEAKMMRTFVKEFVDEFMAGMQKQNPIGQRAAP